MSNRTIIFFFGLLAAALFGLPKANAQQVVWPGDVNNNGVVNGADLLYLGYAHNLTGAERAEKGHDWQPYDVATPAWPLSFPNGISYSFADVDGDGEVDNSDAEKIGENFWLEHGALQADGYGPGAAAGSTPYKLKLVPSATSLAPGATLFVDVRLENTIPNQPIDSFYGIAFKTSFDGNLVESSLPDNKFIYNIPTSGWIASDYDEQTRNVSKKSVATNRAEFAITRTTRSAISGSGTVGSFAIIIEDIIVGQAIDTFHLTIDSVLLFIGGSTVPSNVSPVQADAIEVLIIPPGVSLSSIPTVEAPKIQVAPNPSQGTFTVSSTQAVEHWTLCDMRGQSVPFSIQAAGANRYRMDARGLPPGTYLLSGRCKDGVLKKCVILH